MMMSFRIHLSLASSFLRNEQVINCQQSMFRYNTPAEQQNVGLRLVNHIVDL